MNWFRPLETTFAQAQGEIFYEQENAGTNVRRLLDRKGLDGFQWKVWTVAASGFLAASYSIFSTSLTAPAIGFLYPGTPRTPLIINLTTLSGSVFGMLVFGYLADRYSRRSVYRTALAIVIFATLGMASAGPGVGNSMDVYGWIGFWRALVGIGIGAVYPLSVTISVEWSSTRSRSTIMSALFLMQPVGQLLAYTLGLAVLVGTTRNIDSTDPRFPTLIIPAIDRFWRIVVGIGAFPALIGLVLAWNMPETPLWLILHSGPGHVGEAGGIYPHNFASTPGFLDPYERREKFGVLVIGQYFSKMREFLSHEDRWRALLGVSIVWFLVDIAFYSLGLDNFKTISTIWLSSPVDSDAWASMCSSSWQVNPADSSNNIYDILRQAIIRNLITVSTGTLAGSIIIIPVINYIPRVLWMSCCFIALAVVFLVNGVTFLFTFESDKFAVAITLYALALLLFNMGPNTMIFMLPAELFGTRYRGALYGIAAASGKLGAIVSQLLISLVVQCNDSSTPRGASRLAGLLIGLCVAMLFGALVTWVWIPEVQRHRSLSRRDGRDGEEAAGEGGERERGEELAEASDDDDVEHPRPALRRLQVPNIPLDLIAEHPSLGQAIGLRRNFSMLSERISRRLRQLRR